MGEGSDMLYRVSNCILLFTAQVFIVFYVVRYYLEIPILGYHMSIDEIVHA